MAVPLPVLPSVQPNSPGPQYQAADRFALAGAEGAALTEAWQGAAQDTAHTAQVVGQLKNDNDVMQAKALDNQYASALRDLTYGTKDTPGFYSKKGQNAIDASGATQEQIKALRQKFLATAGNPHIASLFDEVSAGRENSELTTIDRYTLQEHDQAQKDVSQGRIMGAANDAANAYNDDTIIARSIGIARSETADQLAHDGITDPATIQYQMQQAEGVIIGDTIKAAAAVDLPRAKAILDAYRPMLGGVQAGILEDQMKSWDNAARIDQDRQLELQRKAANDAVNNSFNGYMAKIVGGDKTLTASSIAQDPIWQTPGTDGGSKLLTLNNALNAHATDAGLIAQTSASLFSGITSRPGDPGHITSLEPVNQAYAAGRLDDTHYNFLKGLFDQQSTPDGKNVQTQMGDFVNSFKNSITKPSLGVDDPQGAINFDEWHQFVAGKVREAVAANKSPYELFNARSPEYLGQYAHLFQDNMQQAIDNMLKGLDRGPSTGAPGSAAVVNPASGAIVGSSASTDQAFDQIKAIEFAGGVNTPGNPHYGPLQYDRDTWATFGDDKVPVEQATEAQQRVAFTREVVAYTPALTKSLGFPPTTADIYIAHQQGLGGAKALYGSLDKPAVDVVSRDAILSNGGTPTMTSAQFIAKWQAPFYKGATTADIQAANAKGMPRQVAIELGRILGVNS